MKLFRTFRLDTANHILWRDQDRVPITPRAFDVLTYLVEHAGQVVAQDDIFEALWAETYVNLEILRKYILEVRKALGDRVENPEFVETLPRRGYRFIAPVTDESDEPLKVLTPGAVEGEIAPTIDLEEKRSLRDRNRLWKMALIPLLLILGVASMAGYRRFEHSKGDASASESASIVVLPFTDMSPAKGQEYFSDGLTERLIDDLAKVSGLKVVGRSSAFQFKGKNEDPREVGRKLGVNHILEGSVRREGNHVRITAELIKAEDGFQLWSETYDREIMDVFAVEDEIARSATEALELKLLGSNEQAARPTSHSVNPEAYQDYLQAMYYYNARGQGQDESSKALSYINKSIALDGGYAPAWALRAEERNFLAEDSHTSAVEGLQARTDAEHAIELDPNQPDAYIALATEQLYFEWDWDAANASIQKAAALAPGSVEVIRMSWFLLHIFGKLDQSLKLYKEVVALDPLRASTRRVLALELYEAGRYEEAQTALQEALNLSSQSPYVHFLGGRILLAEGKPQQALAEMDMEPTEEVKLVGQAIAYHSLGREQDSNAALANLIAKYSARYSFQIAEIYAFRGEANKSFEWLERAYQQRDSGLLDVKTDPLLKNIRHDQRYSDLLKKMHLPA